MSLIPELNTAPVIAASQFRFDLKEIIQKHNNGEYKIGDEITSPKFTVGDYFAKLAIYPAACEDEDEGYWSLFLTVKPKLCKASVEFSVRCDAKKRTLKKEPIHGFSEWVGFGCAFENVRVISSNSQCFIVDIKIFDESQTMPEPYNFNDHYLKQQKLIYENSKKNGDVTLVIQDMSAEPQRKKRKPNNSNNGSLDQECIEMKVSSVILRSASDAFAAMFDHEFIESKEKKIIVQSSLRDIDDMYYFLCTNELRDAPRPNTISLFKLAHLYDLTSLSNACAPRMITELEIDNFADVAEAFIKYEIANGYDELVEFGTKHLDEIQSQNGFDELSYVFRRALGWSKNAKKMEKKSGRKRKLNH